jgi:hypothetical protein
MPTPRAPATSVRRRSPTWTAPAGALPSAVSAAWKMRGSGAHLVGEELRAEAVEQTQTREVLAHHAAWCQAGVTDECGRDACARETLDCLDRTFHRDHSARVRGVLEARHQQLEMGAVVERGELVHGPGGDLAGATRDARHPELLVALSGAVECTAGGLA